MKNFLRKLFFYPFIVIILWVIFNDIFNKPDVKETQKEIKTKSVSEIRLGKADSSQKACVKTLGQGVYKNNSLSWKLDRCNVPR